MYTVYSTTTSPLPYANVLIVAADPALAVNDPERLVVIPTAAVTPVNPEPSPVIAVAARVPVTVAPELLILSLVVPPVLNEMLSFEGNYIRVSVSPV